MYAELVRKTCTKCLKDQSISEFYRNKRYADGYVTWCRSCKKEHARTNPHIHRNWTKKNKKRSDAIKKKYVEANLDKVRKTKSTWSKANYKK